MQINTPAADINQLTWLAVGQQPRVLRHGGRRFGLGKDDVTDGKQQGGHHGGQGRATCERGHEKPRGQRLGACSLETFVFMSRDGVSKDNTRLAGFHSDTSKKKRHNKNGLPVAYSSTPE